MIRILETIRWYRHRDFKPWAKVLAIWWFPYFQIRVLYFQYSQLKNWKTENLIKVFWKMITTRKYNHIFIHTKYLFGFPKPQHYLLGIVLNIRRYTGISTEIPVFYPKRYDKYKNLPDIPVSYTHLTLPTIYSV